MAPSQKILGFGLVYCLFAAGCTKPAPQLVATKPPEVIVATTTSKKVTDHEDFTGRTEASNEVDIRTQVTGYLDKVFFKDGDDVTVGQPLFEIDPLLYMATLEQSKATATQAKARFDRVTLEYKRFDKLANSPAVSKEDIEKSKGDMDEAEAAWKAAVAAEKLAQANVNYTKIAAKFTGRISRRMVDPGNIVKANDTMLSRLVALDPIYASFDVDERTLLRIRRLVREGKADSARDLKMKVQIGLADEDGYSRVGIVDFIDNIVDAGTGTLRVRATVENKVVGRNVLLSPGLFIRVRIPVGREREAVLVPEEGLASDQGQRYVYVVNAKNEVVYRRVKTGMSVDQSRVVEEGLKAGETVIIRGLQRVKPGVTVNPKTEEQSAKDKDAALVKDAQSKDAKGTPGKTANPAK